MEWFGVDTYFSVFQRPFPDKIKLKLKTSDFLVSCKDFIIILDRLGIVFTFPRMKLDMLVKTIDRKYNENIEENTYIEDMIMLEQNDYELVLTETILLLRRHLQFFLEFFESICNDEMLQENISVFAKVSYKRNLEQYQTCCCNFMYSGMIAFLPSRKNFLKKLAFGRKDCEELALYDMHDFTVSLRDCVNHLLKFYIVCGLEWVYKY